MKIFIEDYAENINIEEEVTMVVEVSDTIFPPGISSSVLTTEGDIVVRGSAAPQRLGIGTEGQALVVDPAVSGKLKWAVPGSVGLGLWNALPATATRASSTSFTFPGDADDAALMEATALKWIDTGATKRGVVTNASHSGGTVTVTIAGDTLAASATMSSFQYTRFHREMQVVLCVPGIDLATGDSKANMPVPLSVDGWYVHWVYAWADTAPTGAAISIMLVNNDNDMLSTALTIDATEQHSKDAATPPVINATYNQLTFGQDVDVDVDQVGSTEPGEGVTVAIIAAPA